MTIIPLDVCFEAVLQLKDLTQVENGDFREFLNQLCIPYSEGNQKEEGIPGIIMYDPLAIFCASYPDAFDYEELYVQVDCGNGIARGMSIADRRLSCTEKPNTRVATKMNFDRFKDHFFNSLNNVTFNPSWSYTI